TSCSSSSLQGRLRGSLHLKPGYLRWSRNNPTRGCGVVRFREPLLGASMAPPATHAPADGRGHPTVRVLQGCGTAGPATSCAEARSRCDPGLRATETHTKLCT